VWRETYVMQTAYLEFELPAMGRFDPFFPANTLVSSDVSSEWHFTYGDLSRLVEERKEFIDTFEAFREDDE